MLFKTQFYLCNRLMLPCSTPSFRNPCCFPKAFICDYRRPPPLTPSPPPSTHPRVHLPAGLHTDIDVLVLVGDSEDLLGPAPCLPVGIPARPSLCTSCPHLAPGGGGGVPTPLLLPLYLHGLTDPPPPPSPTTPPLPPRSHRPPSPSLPYYSPSTSTVSQTPLPLPPLLLPLYLHGLTDPPPPPSPTTPPLPPRSHRPRLPLPPCSRCRFFPRSV